MPTPKNSIKREWYRYMNKLENGYYGETFKDVIQEKFGGEIMSAIDFSIEVDKIENPKKNQVLLSLNGKFALHPTKVGSSLLMINHTNTFFFNEK